MGSFRSILLLGKNPLYSYIAGLTLGLDIKKQTYEDLLGSKKLEFQSDKLGIILFFPYTFWDTYCEVPKDTRVYGTSAASYRLFKNFWIKVERKIHELYNDKEIEFLNYPRDAHIDRDKILTHRILEEAGVNVTETIESRDVDVILSEVTSERGVFIKSLYGAEGKGITYISKCRWVTNYKVYKNNSVGNYGVYDNWPFTNITGNMKFVGNLLKNKVIIEKEIVSPDIFPKEKFDIRAYVLGEKIPHMFVRHCKTRNIITNWSQGGVIEHDYKKVLPMKYIKSIIKQSKAAARALNAKFLGVDCMFDKDSQEAIVVEAQMFPGFPKPEVCHLGKDIIKYMTK